MRVPQLAIGASMRPEVSQGRSNQGTSPRLALNPPAWVVAPKVGNEMNNPNNMATCISPQQQHQTPWVTPRGSWPRSVFHQLGKGGKGKTSRLDPRFQGVKGPWQNSSQQVAGSWDVIDPSWENDGSGSKGSKQLDELHNNGSFDAPVSSSLLDVPVGHGATYAHRPAGWIDSQEMESGHVPQSPSIVLPPNQQQDQQTWSDPACMPTDSGGSFFNTASGTFTSHQIPHTTSQMSVPMLFQTNMSSHVPAGELKGVQVPPPGNSPGPGMVGPGQPQLSSAGSVEGSNADITALVATVSGMGWNLAHSRNSTVAAVAPASPISPIEEAGGPAG